MTTNPPVDLNKTLGAVFIGNIAASMLFGITSLQTHTFFLNNTRDRRSFKRLIAFLWSPSISSESPHVRTDAALFFLCRRQAFGLLAPHFYDTRSLQLSYHPLRRFRGPFYTYMELAG
ncbi:hypothetical protein D9619_004985 [Psilocybe cf. subviscida]|uniref:Uncharacterized protein n=1 Tax=Psilocybe cf. subviscida TaxID=2480587 RepID=A0A8H5F8J8_9AGAR|nr:hypothetical protein D9619_004985 [Psilocybe cf. subviscida]